MKRLHLFPMFNEEQASWLQHEQASWLQHEITINDQGLDHKFYFKKYYYYHHIVLFSGFFLSFGTWNIDNLDSSVIQCWTWSQLASENTDDIRQKGSTRSGIFKLIIKIRKYCLSSIWLIYRSVPFSNNFGYQKADCFYDLLRFLSLSLFSQWKVLVGNLKVEADSDQKNGLILLSLLHSSSEPFHIQLFSPGFGNHSLQWC